MGTRAIRAGAVYVALIVYGASVFGQGAIPPALEAYEKAPIPRDGFSPSIEQVTATPSGASRQVNVNALGENIVRDAANEPSICIDPLQPNRIAIGWRQFNSVTNDFRQAGFAYSTNGGITWSSVALLQTNVFRSDPVLAADASGGFYYLSLQPSPFRCDVWKSLNGGARWQRLGGAFGGDKAWMAIDTTSSPGRGHLYEAWSTAQNTTTNRIFSRSIDGGLNWSDPIAIPQTPYWGTLDVGPRGELYAIGWNGSAFWMNRSTNATNGAAAFRFDLTRQVNLAGAAVIGGAGSVNPQGLIGQSWIAVDRSTGPTRGNVYVLCSVSATATASNPADVMFARSTNNGATWSSPRRINDDAPNRNMWHWFGTLSVAPNGRIDACWYDTRDQTNSDFSVLYYSSSSDGGLTWSANYPVSPSFNHTLGYPMQQKIGDYIGMVSLNEAACIAYAATFNGEQDIYFRRVQPAVITSIVKADTRVALAWTAVPGHSYCVQFNDRLNAPWSPAATVAWVMATNSTAAIQDSSISGVSQRFYRIVEQP